MKPSLPFKPSESRVGGWSLKSFYAKGRNYGLLSREAPQIAPRRRRKVLMPLWVRGKEYSSARGSQSVGSYSLSLQRATSKMGNLVVTLVANSKFSRAIGVPVSSLLSAILSWAYMRPSVIRGSQSAHQQVWSSPQGPNSLVLEADHQRTKTCQELLNGLQGRERDNH
jgi:hypothetical protein